mmetsp:Transcript_49397/g.124380  ORF Transcript_49397/g.124380 Transcript_49397/m.124380 type:complete len:507 (+) Transcript_49397:85-1605(+)
MLPSYRLPMLILLATLISVSGHGRLTVPQARNLNDNGAVGGGPGAVHEFDVDGHAKYQHGICGNAAGVPQTYNAVGEVQGKYQAGSIAEFHVVITAHHVGFFEFELCENAGELSEECFMKHRLLKEGCECNCGSDATNSCLGCQECRRWWKPLLEGETGQTVASGYAGPLLPGQGNLVPYEYIMRFQIPAGVKTSNGVLRWHYMTTNSCTSKSSAPEEFWNCVDVAISDSDDVTDFGGHVSYDNTVLQGMIVSDLIPLIDTNMLTGVNAHCPEDAGGNLLGVGTAEEYNGLCGAASGDSYENCKNLAEGNGENADCVDPPASGILCESECSTTWFACAGSIAYPKDVPDGTRCKDNSFVLEATCAGSAMTPEPHPQPEPEPTEAPTPLPATLAPAPVPSSAPSPVSTVPPMTATTAVPTSAPAPPPPVSCNACSKCLWSNGVCYSDIDQAYCLGWPDNVWCGAQGLAQQKVRVRPHGFLGNAFIQADVALDRSVDISEKRDVAGEL